jgi:hypothetical protein
MATATGRTAIARLGQFSIRPYAGLGVKTPEQAIVGTLHRRVSFSQNELPLPT